MPIPVEIPTLIAFAVAAFAIVVSPGPDTILILQNSAVGSRRRGLFTVAGVQFGLIAHTTLAVVGLSLVISSFPIMVKAIALLGALYLAWLAVRIMRGGAIALETETGGPRSAGVWQAFVDAFLCNLLNPKVLLIYLALMPNFVAVGVGSIWLQLLVLGVVLIAINTTWQVPLSIAANAASRWLERPWARSILSGASGTILMLFALAMIYEHLWSGGRSIASFE